MVFCIVLRLVCFERPLYSAQVSGQSCPWPLKLMMSQAGEGTWIHTSGYRWFRVRFRGEWVNVFYQRFRYLGNTVKFRKLAPGLIFFKGPFWGAYFWRGLYSKGLVYGGECTFQNRLGKPYSWKEICRFCFVLLCIWGQFPSTSPRGSLYLEGQFNGAFFALWVWGAYIWRGLYMERLIFGISR